MYMVRERSLVNSESILMGTLLGLFGKGTRF